KLFAQSPFTFGSDLYSRNIQRGRDHGIPGYVEWYNSCADNDQPHIFDWEDLVGLMPDCVIAVFHDLYDSVHDIDLFPAGIAEYEVPGGLVGPTFACIIAEHFSNLKFGDRFWFQKSGVFTSNQVSTIRETRLSTLICLYTNVDKIQPYVMLPHTGNSGFTSIERENVKENKNVLKRNVHDISRWQVKTIKISCSGTRELKIQRMRF
ncbi:Peroxidasin-like protein, partial [Armadillidium vulgare]